MARYMDPHHRDFVERIAERAVRRLGPDKGKGIKPFIADYFANVPLREIHDETPDDLFGAAFSHWRLCARRPPGQALVRVYNPRLDEHGWRSEHTIVEVVTDNMPFLVDSLTAELNRRGLFVHLVIHPMFAALRDGSGELLNIDNRKNAAEGAAAESLMHFEVTRQSGEVLDAISDGVRNVLDDVRVAVEDWVPMRERLGEIIEAFDGTARRAPPEQAQEAKAFLEWLRENHFVFVGSRSYTLNPEDVRAPVSIVPESGLGLLRDPEVFAIEDVRHATLLPQAVAAFAARDELVTITKADKRSTVHRPVPLDAVGIRTFDADGRVVGLCMFIGLFTSVAYTRSPNAIPIIRRKIRTAMERAGFDPAAHDGKALLNILDTFPRDELLQVSEDHLLQTALGILYLQERQRAALFIRRDDFERFVTCLIYVPRDRYTTALRREIEEFVERTFGGRVISQFGEVGDSPLARLYMVIRTETGKIAEYDPAEVEATIVDITQTWSDHLLAALVDAHGEEEAHRLHREYGSAFPVAYQERFSAEEAVVDISSVEAAIATGQLQTALYRPFDVADHCMRFKIYHPATPVVLSDVLPVLEHLGLRVLDEMPYEVRVAVDGGRTIQVHDFGLEAVSGAAIDLGAIREPFREAFLDVWTGGAESDRFNSLVLEAGLACREVVILRAYAKYLRQTGMPFSLAYLEMVLAANSGLARLIVDLFRALFDVDARESRNAAADAIRERIAAGLEEVASADDDRIIRRFVNAVDSTLRTNYFQTTDDGQPKPYVAFKLDSRQIDELPLPRPMVETFVYSPRMEGIHLRGGKVARGGIRWSDRREDFRTEILGLMKAQQVKNAVIVPVGAKGGFILKRPPAASDREALQAEGEACYRMLISGLLDLADNRAGDEIVPPPRVVRRDDDDPYLVVAADKGTATFSDIANGISDDYGFWLGDAFASGGSNGYDHKKMGITARGAWESVKRHFREIGTNIQEAPFTVVGVGDMSGDVFGNGMLLSPCTKLVAAFNHMHIFVDPDPDPAVSFAERQRLFGLPRSGWSDYDAKALSAGGRIFERRAKSLTLTPEIKARFGIGQTQVTPQELVRVLLKAEVDLLWFGGIGTYVKAGTESHTEAGDRSNDAIRVDATQLRCKVIGEGANLGATQLGRIEFARAGGRINTDFIDNSAGVDCSDHEVNIKILLDTVVADGDMTEKQRNSLLNDMTDEVANLVLRDNYLQTQALTLIEAEDGGLDSQTRLMRSFERQGRLNRVVEGLPDDEALEERAAAGQGLTRPEISSLFSHCKIWLYDEVIASDLPDERHMAQDVVRYFPSAVQERFGERIARHRLRRELIATSLTNSLVNRVGGTFVTGVGEKTGMPPVDIARAYIIARDVYGARAIWAQIEALDNMAPAAAQTTLHREVQRLLERGTLWFLRNGGSPIDITVNVEAFRAPVAALAGKMSEFLPDDMNGRILHRAKRYEDEGVPEALAADVAYLIAMPSACDIVRIAAKRGVDVEAIARLYFAVGEHLGFGWLRYQAEKLTEATHWQKLALAATIEELYAHQSAITVSVMEAAGGAADGAIDAWAEKRNSSVGRMRSLLAELEASTPVDLSMLTVASRQLGALVTA